MEAISAAHLASAPADMTRCQLRLYLYTPDLSAAALCLAQPQHPKIEIITTGREKRKSENVSEWAYADPPPIFSQSLHASLLLSPVWFVVGRPSADEGRRPPCVCVVCVGWLSAAE